MSKFNDTYNSFSENLNISLTEKLSNVSDEVSGFSYEQFMKKYKNNILYHASDSDFFTEIDIGRSEKGVDENFFNPLGRGIYLSRNKEFTRGFGKNTYIYVVPKSAKIKRVGFNKWHNQESHVIFKGVLRKLGIKYDDLDIGKRIELSRIGRNVPIVSMNDFSAWLHIYYPDLKEIQSIIENFVTERNAKYDAIQYKDTDYYQEADEWVIPTHQWNSNNFFKDENDLKTKLDLK